ncbi:MAG: helix-turn-helix transcriptional regulator, partial [Actinobacteria bacterium]|nr:helix-turn-helix transcriptional regulator [Actinomycetota bacterium]
MDGDYAKALGASLRNIRVQKNLSLQDVQQSSAGKWKAAVIGAYERGDRNVTVTKLFDLAAFYGVPMSEIIPDDGAPPAPGTLDGRRRVVLDLEGLAKVPEEDR